MAQYKDAILLKRCLFLLLCFYFFLVHSQESGSNYHKTEKSIFGIQTGLIGLWVHHEARILDDVFLRSEVGLDMVDFFRSDVYPSRPEVAVGGPFFAPTIALEPRWYYNKKRRLQQNRSITKNSANFIALETKYYPDFFLLTGAPQGTRLAEQLAICPRWGLKRTFSEHFTYELGVGYKIYYLLRDSDRARVNNAEGFLNAHVKFGYTF